MQELTFFEQKPYTFEWSKIGDPNFAAYTEDISDLDAGTCKLK